MADGLPRVSVGVPVHNGSDTLARALESVMNQSYPNLEIVISDNASTDDTAAVCRRAAAGDTRVRYIRQPQLVPVLDNYRRAFEETHGDLFMWAAHDDLRSVNYVETLVAAFRADPAISLAASDFVEFAEFDDAFRRPRCHHDFATVGLGLAARLRKHTKIGCNHVYGLLNARYMRAYRWYNDVSWDVAFLAYMAARGPFVYVPGATFYYRRLPARTVEARARETSFGRVRPFQRAHTAWLTARAVSAGHRSNGRWRPTAAVFPVVLFYIMQGVRGLIAAATPRAVRAALKRSVPPGAQATKHV